MGINVFVGRIQLKGQRLLKLQILHLLRACKLKEQIALCFAFHIAGCNIKQLWMILSTVFVKSFEGEYIIGFLYEMKCNSIFP